MEIVLSDSNRLDNTVFKDAETLNGDAVRVFFDKQFEGEFMNLHRTKFEGTIMNIKERGYAPLPSEKRNPLSYAETLLACFIPCFVDQYSSQKIMNYPFFHSSCLFTNSTKKEFRFDERPRVQTILSVSVFLSGKDNQMYAAAIAFLRVVVSSMCFESYQIGMYVKKMVETLNSDIRDCVFCCDCVMVKKILMTHIKRDNVLSKHITDGFVDEFVEYVNSATYVNVEEPKPGCKHAHMEVFGDRISFPIDEAFIDRANLEDSDGDSDSENGDGDDMLSDDGKGDGESDGNDDGDVCNLSLSEGESGSEDGDADVCVLSLSEGESGSEDGDADVCDLSLSEGESGSEDGNADDVSDANGGESGSEDGDVDDVSDANGDVSDLFGRVKALEKMAAKVPVLEETLKKLQAKFDELEKRFTLHLSHPEIGNAADNYADDGFDDMPSDESYGNDGGGASGNGDDDDADTPFNITFKGLTRRHTLPKVGDRLVLGQSLDNGDDEFVKVIKVEIALYTVKPEEGDISSHAYPRSTYQKLIEHLSHLQNADATIYYVPPHSYEIEDGESANGGESERDDDRDRDNESDSGSDGDFEQSGARESRVTRGARGTKRKHSSTSRKLVEKTPNMTSKAGNFDSKFVVSTHFFSKYMSTGFDDPREVCVVSMFNQYQSSVEDVQSEGGICFCTKQGSTDYLSLFERAQDKKFVLLYRNAVRRTSPKGFGYGIFGIAIGPFEIQICLDGKAGIFKWSDAYILDKSCANDEKIDFLKNKSGFSPLPVNKVYLASDAASRKVMHQLMRLCCCGK